MFFRFILFDFIHLQIVIKNLILLDINPDDIIAIGITNQRQTTVLWNKTNGVPLHNAIGRVIN